MWFYRLLAIFEIFVGFIFCRNGIRFFIQYESPGSIIFITLGILAVIHGLFNLTFNKFLFYSIYVAFSLACFAFAYAAMTSGNYLPSTEIVPEKVGRFMIAAVFTVLGLGMLKAMKPKHKSPRTPQP